ncbi:MAG: hypothetical protein E7595_07350 [Ruminococcaceae bacterium]|nr:hypothetical protein [Oscillospiraceae bacterium]
MKKSFALLALILAFSMLFAACGDDALDVSDMKSDFVCVFVINQVNDEQKLNVSYSSDQPITKLEVSVKHGDSVVSNEVFEGDALKNNNVDINAYYGKHTVSIRATSEAGGTAEVFKEVALSASEYVIAPISGSMPQLYFTLNLKEITDNYQIPAFVWLARPDSWNWEKLPENVYAFPTVPLEEVLTHNNYDKMVEATDAYIEELYSINKNSKFNLYINDYNSYLYLKLLAGNGIPENNYYVTLLSDGGASYHDFNLAFNIDEEGFDADIKYAEMAEKLATLYGEVREAGDYNGDDSKFSVGGDEFRQYSYVAAKEMNNVEWWILRPRAGVLCSPDEEFINNVLTVDKTEGIIEERNFANPLKAMSDEEKASLKSLYNFNNEMFEAADEAGKKAMMILGSWANPENEPDFEDYVNLVKAFYGEEEFVYYYKGHPNTPTSLFPDKQDQLEDLDLIDVESSINAELILFFYPDIYMCGYNSSTFMSVESAEMACCMFNMSIADAEANDGTSEYRGLIGIYTSKITEGSEYASLCEGDGNFYLVEFNNADAPAGASFAIYNAEENSFSYYNANKELVK